jgi:formate dehydrogenase iron-sulfur subunit
MAVSAFLTDSTLCIGCKACEVACKEWNQVPEDGLVWTGLSYDNTLPVGHSTWRHVKFVEQDPEIGAGGNAGRLLSWAFSSDVCKHCEVAGCLEACPTGAIVRTEQRAVYIQADVCNGCGYCVVACPFGVVDRREDGLAYKCTFCYDRQKAGLEPACAKACPTDSILFGDLDELRDIARRRIDELHGRGMHDAAIYDPRRTSVEGIHAFFILRGDARAYNLPPSPEVPAVLNSSGWGSALATAGLIVAGTFLAFFRGSVSEHADTGPGQ